MREGRYGPRGTKGAGLLGAGTWGGAWAVAQPIRAPNRMAALGRAKATEEELEAAGFLWAFVPCVAVSVTLLRFCCNKEVYD